MSFSTLTSGRFAATYLFARDTFYNIDFQYPHIGSVRCNVMVRRMMLRVMVPFSTLTSGRFAATFVVFAPHHILDNFQYPHIGSVRCNRGFNISPTAGSNFFQYPHIGSVRCNASRLRGHER